MRDHSVTWFFSEINKKLFFSAYKKRIDHSVWVKASREGLQWLQSHDDSDFWNSLPELNYDISKNRGLFESVQWPEDYWPEDQVPSHVMTEEDLLSEITWQQRYFFELPITKGSLMSHHPAYLSGMRKPNLQRTAQLVYNLYFYLCKPQP